LECGGSTPLSFFLSFFLFFRCWFGADAPSAEGERKERKKEKKKKKEKKERKRRQAAALQSYIAVILLSVNTPDFNPSAMRSGFLHRR
jgi:hypothetical protein